MALTDREKALYASAESLGGRTIDSGPVTFWMDKIKAGAPRPTDSSGNAQMAYAQAQWALQDPAREKAIRDAGSQKIVLDKPIYEAYGLTPPQAEQPTKKASIWDNLRDFISKKSLSGSTDLIKPIQPSIDDGGGLNLSWDPRKDLENAGNSIASGVKGAAGIVLDPWGINRGAIDVLTGKPWDPKSQLGNVIGDWQNYGGFAGDVMGGVYSPIANQVGLPTISDTIKGGIGGAAGKITKGTPVDQSGGGGGGGSTMGDNIPMPELPGYQSAIGQNIYAPSGIPQSPWRAMALDKQAAEEAGLRDQAAQQSMSGMAQARNALAMRGGLRGGAAERISRGGLSDLMSARQNVGQQGVINRANIGMQGAQMDTDVNKFNAGLGAEAQKFNISNALQDVANQNEWNKFKYGEQMKLKGAGMTGQAIKNAGKK